MAAEPMMDDLTEEAETRALQIIESCDGDIEAIISTLAILLVLAERNVSSGYTRRTVH